jgi:SAM-dependent methyltransferase
LDLVETTSGAPSRRHPWEEARYAFFRRVLARAALLRPGTSVLDVGSGDAWLAARLSGDTGAAITCWDVAYAPAAPPGLPQNVRLTARPPEGRFEVILALDVLEHVEDDRGFLREVVAERLAEGGALLLSVPAWPSLTSRHDAAMRHLRRYAPAEARAVLDAAGLAVEAGGGLFHSLLLPRALQRLAQRGDGPPPPNLGEWRAPGWLTALVRGALGADAAASALFARLGLDVPGLSWWALCRRR